MGSGLLSALTGGLSGYASFLQYEDKNKRQNLRDNIKYERQKSLEALRYSNNKALSDSVYARDEPYRVLKEDLSKRRMSMLEQKQTEDIAESVYQRGSGDRELITRKEEYVKLEDSLGSSWNKQQIDLFNASKAINMEPGKMLEMLQLQRQSSNPPPTVEALKQAGNILDRMSEETRINETQKYGGEAQLLSSIALQVGAPVDNTQSKNALINAVSTGEVSIDALNSTDLSTDDKNEIIRLASPGLARIAEEKRASGVRDRFKAANKARKSKITSPRAWWESGNTLP